MISIHLAEALDGTAQELKLYLVSEDSLSFCRRGLRPTDDIESGRIVASRERI